MIDVLRNTSQSLQYYPTFTYTVGFAYNIHKVAYCNALVPTWTPRDLKEACNGESCERVFCIVEFLWIGGLQRGVAVLEVPASVQVH